MKTSRIVMLAVLGCAATPAAAQTPVGRADSVVGPYVTKTFDRPFAVHGVAADDQLLFVTEVMYEPQIHVSERLTGRDLGSLPQPPAGLNAPMNVRLRNVASQGQTTRGELIVLDAFGPSMIGVAPARLYVYSYEYSHRRGLEAALTTIRELPMNTNPPTDVPNGFVYPSGFELLPGGDVVVVDVVGLYVSDARMQSWRLALASPEFAPSTYCSTVTFDGEEVPGFYMAVRDERGRKVRVPYQMNTGGMGPIMPGLKGITYVDLLDKVAFIKVASPGGIFMLDRQVLLDPTIPPFMKSYQRLVEPELGLSDFSGDVAYDHHDPDSEWVYWQRVPSEPGQDTCAGAHPFSEKWSPLYRVSVLTGELQLVAESWLLYDFPTVLGILPPIWPNDPFTHLTSSNVAEERIPELNALVTDPDLIAPTIVPAVLVDAH